MRSPLGAAIRPLIAQLGNSGNNIPIFRSVSSDAPSNREPSPEFDQLNTDIEEAR